MKRQTIDPRISASSPSASLRDLLSPILSDLELTDDPASLNLDHIRRQLRHTYALARDFEAEVSRLRWELKSTQDAERNNDERLLRALELEDCNIVLFPGGSEVPIFQEGE